MESRFYGIKTGTRGEQMSRPCAAEQRQTGTWAHWSLYIASCGPLQEHTDSTQ